MPGTEHNEQPATGSLRCSVCGKPPWWTFPREGDRCYEDDGGTLVRADAVFIETWDERVNLQLRAHRIAKALAVLKQRAGLDR